jgi:hypothetical protein
MTKNEHGVYIDGYETLKATFGKWEVTIEYGLSDGNWISATSAGCPKCGYAFPLSEENCKFGTMRGCIEAGWAEICRFIARGDNADEIIDGLARKIGIKEPIQPDLFEM